MIMYSDPISEIHSHRLLETQRTADIFANLNSLFSEQAQVATGLTAAEWRAVRQKMEGCADP